MSSALHSTSIFCVHDREQAITGLRAAAACAARPVLISGPGAALHAGSLWWRALVEGAIAATGIDAEDWLDCADAPGPAMAALRAGCRRIVLQSPSAAMLAMAGAAGCCILPARPAALDLGAPGAAFLLPSWLIGAARLSPPPALATRPTPPKDQRNADHPTRPSHSEPV